MVKLRIEAGILTGDKDKFSEFDQFIQSLTDENPGNTLEKRLKLVTSLCKNLQGVSEVKNIDVREVACSIVRILASVLNQN